MGRPFAVEVLKPEELGPSEAALWKEFRAGSPACDSPYFDLRYIQAAGSVAPHARVAVLHRGGRIAAFFPFQRRGRLVQPLGAPMTDYHGVLARPGETVDPGEIVAALGARVFRFTGLTTGALPRGAATRLTTQQVVAVDLGAGFDAWLAARQAMHPRFFKGKRRTARAIERDLGPLRFEWTRDEDGLLAYILALKRAQYLRTRRHDVFACGWTERLLHRLVEMRQADFGLAFAALYAGDTLVGAEAGLMSGPTHHLWLPVYDPRHARYGPGMLMTIESLRAAAAAGLSKVDFGRNDASYKSYFADPAGSVLEGYVRAPGAFSLDAASDRLLRGAPEPFWRLAGLRDRIRRRMDVIAACETTAMGWCAGAAMALGVTAGVVSPSHHVTALARRPHEQRPGPTVVARTDGGVRPQADRLQPSAARNGTVL